MSRTRPYGRPAVDLDPYCRYLKKNRLKSIFPKIMLFVFLGNVSIGVLILEYLYLSVLFAIIGIVSVIFEMIIIYFLSSSSCEKKLSGWLLVFSVLIYRICTFSFFYYTFSFISRNIRIEYDGIFAAVLLLMAIILAIVSGIKKRWKSLWVIHLISVTLLYYLEKIKVLKGNSATIILFAIFMFLQFLMCFLPKKEEQYSRSSSYSYYYDDDNGKKQNQYSTHTAHYYDDYSYSGHDENLIRSNDTFLDDLNDMMEKSDIENGGDGNWGRDL